PEPPATIPSALSAAHEAYLEGDFVRMGERIRDVLLDPSADGRVKDNAYALLDKAYESQGGKLPSSFVLPPPFSGVMGFGVTRGTNPHRSWFKTYATVPIRDASRLRGFTVKRLPDEVILDK